MTTTNDQWLALQSYITAWDEIAAMPIERYAITPETVTVLGYRCKPTDEMWRGLRWDVHAEVRGKASIMEYLFGNNAPPDLHLRVFWCHPEDEFDPENECYYRVRPRAKVGKRWPKGKKPVKSVAIVPAAEFNPPWCIEITR